MNKRESANFFLGIDSSTQSMSAIVIDCDNPQNIISLSVNFERDLPEFKTSSGVVFSTDRQGEVWSYPVMWAKALDLLIQKLSRELDLSTIRAISGSGQQHASVWLNSGDVFSGIDNLEVNKLSSYIENMLSRQRSPVWMDTSTSEECAEIELNLGESVLLRSGSVATERFTGAQIRKIFKSEKEVYNSTKRIHLNSSFICSLLTASDSPIDFGDGSGMNLMNLQDFVWDKSLCDVTANNLLAKLPHLVPSSTCVGNVSRYFQRYGFSADCKVFAFTGDNPSSLVGVGASESGTAVISLGTSDTFFCANKHYSPISSAHIFGNPNGGYMNLICFRNGSLAREKLKNELGVDWDFFSASLFDGELDGLKNKFVIPFYTDEISPAYKASAPIFINCERANLSAEELVILFLEAQMFNIYNQARLMNCDLKKVILTGGASRSNAIAKCSANVFGVPVYKIANTTNSAALGAAMRAANLYSNFAIADLESLFCSRELLFEPSDYLCKLYRTKRDIFANIL